MLIDFKAGAPGLIEADVAVIGAGAAGITLSRRLLDAGLTVALLESGGFDFEDATSDLNAGSNVGQDYYDLEDARLRFFGGTTAIWGGRCAELDRIDFERREWVDHSGWPFELDELRSWYSEARALLGLPSDRPPVDRIGLLASLASEEIEVSQWEFDREFDRFGVNRNRDLLAHPRLKLAIHATVREIIPVNNLKAVDRLDVRSPAGHSATVRAKAYVLAAGGLENARLLLASNSVFKPGLGNMHDSVGRYFMEHPHGRGGRLVGAPALPILRAFAKRSNGKAVVAPLLRPSAALQKQLGILNSGVTIAARPPVDGRHSLFQKAYIYAKHTASPTRAARNLWKTQRRAGRGIKRLIGPAAPWWRLVTGRNELTLVLRAEQAPNRQSRVTLGAELDAIGMPRLRLDWRLTEQDVRTAAELVKAVNRAFRNADMGQVEIASWLQAEPTRWQSDPFASAHPLGGYHHLGTTRMADDPRQGVTDSYGRVHGLHNLWVGGSSLFPTGGWANPTLTILALALRTADHLSKTAFRPLVLAEHRRAS